MIKIKNISVVIPSAGKREEELKKIILHLKEVGFEDIIIRYDDDTPTINGDINRLLAVEDAKNDIIYSQDDDCMIHNIGQLIKNYKKDSITHNMTAERMRYYNSIGLEEMPLIGWGAIYHKDLLDNIQPYLDKYGVDDLFRRDANRVFAWMNKKITLISDNHIEHFPSEAEGISKDSSFHEKCMWDMAERLKTLN